jgi:hypothetical protein
VILVLKPRGRGNWQPTTLAIEGRKHAPLPIEVAKGDTIVIAGRIYRVAKVYS